MAGGTEMERMSEEILNLRGELTDLGRRFATTSTAVDYNQGIIHEGF